MSLVHDERPHEEKRRGRASIQILHQHNFVPLLVVDEIVHHRARHRELKMPIAAAQSASTTAPLLPEMPCAAGRADIDIMDASAGSSATNKGIS